MISTKFFGCKMMSYIYLNGKIIEREEPSIHSWNRAFHYGDGIFETVRMVNGKLLFWDDHWERLGKGLDVLKLLIPDQIDIRKQVEQLADKNGVSNSARIRTTVYREGEGAYRSSSHQSGLLIEAESVSASITKINEEGLTVGLFENAFKSTDALSSFKTCSALLYIMASIDAQEKGLDDCIIKNSKGRICEATSSNLFYVKDGNIYTPSLSEGPVAGVMRNQVIELAKANHLEIAETQILKEDLLSADEIFLTNSIQGIKWVKDFEGCFYSNDLSVKLSGFLNDQISALVLNQD